MSRHLPLHDRFGVARRKCLKPFHLLVGDKVRVTRRIGNEYRRG